MRTSVSHCVWFSVLVIFCVTVCASYAVKRRERARYAGQIAVEHDLQIELDAGAVGLDDVDHALRVLFENRPGVIRLRFRKESEQYDRGNVDDLRFGGPFGQQNRLSVDYE